MTATWQSFVGRNTNITSTDVLHNDLILLQGKVVHILTVEELFEEDGPDLFRKGQLFQDSGLLPEFLMMTIWMVVSLGVISLETKASGKILQVALRSQTHL